MKLLSMVLATGVIFSANGADQRSSTPDQEIVIQKVCPSAPKKKKRVYVERASINSRTIILPPRLVNDEGIAYIVQALRNARIDQQ